MPRFQSLIHFIKRISFHIGRSWEWLTYVESADPIRRILNRGLAGVIVILLLSIAVIIPVFILTNDAATVPALVGIPFYVAIWWLNRRGTPYGGALLTLFMILGILLGASPATYVKPDTPIPLVFIFPIMAAALFVRPSAGIAAIVVLMGLVAVQMNATNVETNTAWRFLLIGTLNLAEISVFLVIGSSIFIRALRRSIAANEALQQLNIIEREHRQLAEALRQTMAAITGTLNLDSIMRSLLENVALVVPNERASIALIEGNNARAVYWRNLPPEFETYFKQTTFPLDNSNFGRVWQMGKPHLIPDTSLDPSWIVLPIAARVYSYLGVPIRVHGQIIGVLSLYGTKSNFFSSSDADRLQAFADQAAVALENAQLYSDVRRYANELEQRVEERTKELEQAKERVETILDNSSDVIVLAGADYMIQQINPVFNRVFGYSSTEILGQPLESLVEPDSAQTFAAALQRVSSSKQPDRVEIVACGKDTVRFDADVALSPIVGKVGQGDQVVGFVCSLRDITARKQLEINLHKTLEREVELGELKSRFVSMASHELRTPLTVIQTTHDLLLRAPNQLTPQQQQIQLNRIQKSIQQMVVLLDDVLTFSRADAGKLEFVPRQIDLFQFCQELYNDFRRTAGTRQQFQFTRTGPCAAMWMDEKLLRHIIGNLLANATKYSPDQGTITFELRCNSDHAVFIVSDEGIGIPAADQPYIYQAFHRATNVGATPGTGLGMSIVKQSVDLHGGTITLTSAEQRGTTFTVTLPNVMPESR
jgi:PAS domain S-box-containing protein